MATLFSLLVDDRFTTVRTGLIRLLDGNANAAIVLSRINFRANKNYRNAIEDEDGVWWWRAPFTDISDETGLSVDQVRFALRKLIEGGWIEAVKHNVKGASDHTWSYRVIDRNLPDDDEPRHADLGTVPDRSGNSPRSGLGTVPDLPSVKKREEESLSEVDDFAPSEADITWATTYAPGLDLDLETDYFNAHTKAKGYRYDRPDMAWRTWVMRSNEYVKRGGNRPRAGSSSRPPRNLGIAEAVRASKEKHRELDRTGPPGDVNGAPRRGSWAEDWKREMQKRSNGEKGSDDANDV